MKNLIVLQIALIMALSFQSCKKAENFSHTCTFRTYQLDSTDMPVAAFDTNESFGKNFDSESEARAYERSCQAEAVRKYGKWSGLSCVAN